MKRKSKIILTLALIAAITIGTGIYFSGQSNIDADISVFETEKQKEKIEKNTFYSVSDRKVITENTKHDKTETEPEAPEESKEDPIKTKDRKTDDEGQLSSGDSKEKKGHYEERQVLVKDAYDESVLIRKGECTQFLVKDAYDTQETIYLEGAFYGPDTQEGYVCNGCGAVFFDASINDHIGSPEHPGWHNEMIEISEPYWHNVEYRTVHHEAVYETRCEPDEYETVHHDAVYRTETVWVDD